MELVSYRNIVKPGIFQDDSYGIEGRYMVSISCNGPEGIFIKNNKLTQAGRIVEKFWNEIPIHFNNIEIGDSLFKDNSFFGYIDIDLSGKRIGKKHLYYNVVSQYEIAFGLMVSQKNPFLVEGSLFHVISWFKATTLIEIMKEADPSFKWESGYFDFTVKTKQNLQELLRSLDY